MGNYNKEYIRNIINSMYSIQQLRIQIGNRIVGNIKAKIAGESSPTDEQITDELEGKALKEITADYKRITDFLTIEKNTLKKYFKKPEGIITEEVEYVLVDTYVTMLEKEELLSKQLGKVLKNYPIYTEFLEGVKGCGTTMSAVIISYLDPHQAKYVSSFYRYAGLDVTFVEKEIEGEVQLIGEGTGLKHAKYNNFTYIDKEGNEQTKHGISYNPFLKSKLMGVLATSFLMTGRDGKYAKIYRDYKMRLQNSPKHNTKTPKHIDNMARRYMVKMFIKDLWVEWRTLEGLEVAEFYEIAKLGMAPHTGTEDQAPHVQTQN